MTFPELIHLKGIWLSDTTSSLCSEKSRRWEVAHRPDLSKRAVNGPGRRAGRVALREHVQDRQHQPCSKKSSPCKELNERCMIVLVRACHPLLLFASQSDREISPFQGRYAFRSSSQYTKYLDTHVPR